MRQKCTCIRLIWHEWDKDSPEATFSRFLCVHYLMLDVVLSIHPFEKSREKQMIVRFFFWGKYIVDGILVYIWLQQNLNDFHVPVCSSPVEWGLSILFVNLGYLLYIYACEYIQIWQMLLHPLTTRSQPLHLLGHSQSIDFGNSKNIYRTQQKGTSLSPRDVPVPCGRTHP